MQKNIFKKVLSILIALSLVITLVLPAFAITISEVRYYDYEDGSRHYFLYDANDWGGDSWNKMAESVNALADTSKVTIHVEKNIDFSGYTPVQLTSFNGVLDGHGHTFSNLVMTSSEQNGASLIGTFGGTIQNLSLSNTCSFTNSYNGAQTGPFAAVTTASAVIYNCSVSASVSATTKGDHLGGFVGTANAGLTIDGCIFNGTVTAATGNASALVGYYNTEGTLKIYNTIVMGSVSSGSGADYAGAARFNGKLFNYAEKMPFYNTCVVGMKVAFYYSTIYDKGYTVNGHAYNQAGLEANYGYDASRINEIVWKVNNDYVDTGRERVWFTIEPSFVNNGTTEVPNFEFFETVSFGSANNHVVKMTVVNGSEITANYYLPKKLFAYGSTYALARNQIDAADVPSVDGMVAVVDGAEYRDGIIYIGNTDFAVSFITEAENTLNQAKKKLQGLVDAYKAMDSKYFTNWDAKQAWLTTAEAVLLDPNSDAAALQAQITAEGKLADGVVAMEYPNYPSIEDYCTYQPIASIKDYSVGSAEEWRAAVAMSNFLEEPDAVQFTGITIHLTNTIDLGSQAILPLCYAGVFDGNINGHDLTFENLKIELDTPYGPVGLIGNIGIDKYKPRTIQNLGIGSGSITVTGYPRNKQSWNIGDIGNKAGGIVGRAHQYGLVLRKCWTNVDINVSNNDNAGGVIGDSRRVSYIDGCFSLGSSNSCGLHGYGAGTLDGSSGLLGTFNSLSMVSGSSAFRFNYSIVGATATETTDVTVAPTEEQLATYLENIQKRIKNSYGIKTPLSFSGTANVHNKAARDAFNAEMRIGSLAEGAWRANQNYVDMSALDSRLGGERIYYTLDENGQLAFGNAENQVRRITLKCGEDEQYLYGVPGQTITLSYNGRVETAKTYNDVQTFDGATFSTTIATDVGEEFYRYNYFAFAGETTKSTIKDNKLTLGNEDVIIDVAKEVDRGDVNDDGAMNLLDALTTVKRSVDADAAADLLAANVDSNHIVDLRDAIMIVRQWLNAKNDLFTAGGPTEDAEDYLKVVSYNIKSFHYDPTVTTNTSNNGVAMFKYQPVADQITAMKPDIIGLQEVDVGDGDSNDLDQIQLLVDELEAKTGVQYNGSFFLTVDDKDLVGGYGHGIISKYTILEEGGDYFAGELQENGRRMDGIEPRGFAWYKLDINGNGTFDKDADVVCYNSHLANYTNLQLKYMVDYMKANHADCRIISTGDYNLSAWEMKGYLDTDNFTALNGGDRFDCYNPYSAGHTNVIDNVIISDNLQCFRNDGINNAMFTHDTEASDHRPIWTYIKK